MNEERASYALGYQAVGSVREIDPKYDFAAAQLIIVPKAFYTVPQPDEIRYRENRKAWFDGYLDRSLEIGGRQVKIAMDAYSRNYPLNMKPETVRGRQYTLFFEQVDTHKWHKDRFMSSQLAEIVPLPVLRLEIAASNFPQAIRQGWATIANSDTSFLASVSLLGAYLPINLDDPLKNLLHRYYNAAIDVDSSKQKLMSQRRQFSREASTARPISEIVAHERMNKAAYKAVEQELAGLYKSFTGKRPPPFSDIFMREYVEDIVRGLPESAEKDSLEIMLDDYECSGNPERLAAYVSEGVMPDGDICTENIPILEWDLYEEIFLTDQNGWSPLRKLYNEVQTALHDAQAGNTEKLEDLMRTCQDKRPLAKYANELMEAGCMETVDAMLTAMQKHRVPYVRSYLTEQNRIQLDIWMGEQQQNASPCQQQM